MTTINITSAELLTIIDDPKKLFNYLKELLSDIENESIMIRGLNSNQRHLIYKQMMYPLKFVKIKECKTSNDVTIRVYKNNNNNKKEKFETKTKSDECVSDPDYNPTKDSKSDDSEEEDSEEEDSEEYSNEKITREYIELMLDIQNKTCNKLEDIEKNTKKIIRRTNILMIISVIGWTLLITLDPVKLIVSCEQTTII